MHLDLLFLTAAFVGVHSAPINCSGNGNLNDDGTCRCDKHFFGSRCELALDLSGCPGDCNGRGECDLGRCICQMGFEGLACEQGETTGSAYTLSRSDVSMTEMDGMTESDITEVAASNYTGAVITGDGKLSIFQWSPPRHPDAKYHSASDEPSNSAQSHAQQGRLFKSVQLQFHNHSVLAQKVAFGDGFMIVLDQFGRLFSAVTETIEEFKTPSLQALPQANNHIFGEVCVSDRSVMALNLGGDVWRWEMMSTGAPSRVHVSSPSKVCQISCSSGQVAMVLKNGDLFRMDTEMDDTVRVEELPQQVCQVSATQSGIYALTVNAKEHHQNLISVRNTASHGRQAKFNIQDMKVHSYDKILQVSCSGENLEASERCLVLYASGELRAMQLDLHTTSARPVWHNVAQNMAASHRKTQQVSSGAFFSVASNNRVSESRCPCASTFKARADPGDGRPVLPMLLDGIAAAEADQEAQAEEGSEAKALTDAADAQTPDKWTQQFLDRAKDQRMSANAFEQVEFYNTLKIERSTESLLHPKKQLPQPESSLFEHMMQKLKAQMAQAIIANEQDKFAEAAETLGRQLQKQKRFSEAHLISLISSGDGSHDPIQDRVSNPPEPPLFSQSEMPSVPRNNGQPYHLSATLRAPVQSRDRLLLLDSVYGVANNSFVKMGTGKLAEYHQILSIKPFDTLVLMWDVANDFPAGTSVEFFLQKSDMTTAIRSSLSHEVASLSSTMDELAWIQTLQAQLNGSVEVEKQEALHDVAADLTSVIKFAPAVASLEFDAKMLKVLRTATNIYQKITGELEELPAASSAVAATKMADVGDFDGNSTEDASEEMKAAMEGINAEMAQYQASEKASKTTPCDLSKLLRKVTEASYEINNYTAAVNQLAVALAQEMELGVDSIKNLSLAVQRFNNTRSLSPPNMPLNPPPCAPGEVAPTEQEAVELLPGQTLSIGQKMNLNDLSNVRKPRRILSQEYAYLRVNGGGLDAVETESQPDGQPNATYTSAQPSRTYHTTQLQAEKSPADGAGMQAVGEAAGKMPQIWGGGVISGFVAMRERQPADSVLEPWQVDMKPVAPGNTEWAKRSADSEQEAWEETDFSSESGESGDAKQFNSAPMVADQVGDATSHQPSPQSSVVEAVEASASGVSLEEQDFDDKLVNSDPPAPAVPISQAGTPLHHQAHHQPAPPALAPAEAYFDDESTAPSAQQEQQEHHAEEVNHDPQGVVQQPRPPFQHNLPQAAHTVLGPSP